MIMRFCFHLFRLAALACAIAAAAPAAADAQTVSFVFVGPTTAMTSNFGAANVRGGYADGYRGVTVTAANLATFRKVAPANMQKTYDVLQPGTALRKKVDRLLALSKGNVLDVQIQLVDDHAGLTGRFTFAENPGADGKVYVWPAAWSDPLTAPKKGWQGIIGVGEYWAADLSNPDPKKGIGWTGWESVILHETLHTQFVGQATKWGSTTITYGLDGMHDFSEILGAQDLTFEEGLGTFYGYTHYDPQGYNETNTVFANAGDRYITEDASIPASWELRKFANRKVKVPIPARVKREQPSRTEYHRYYFYWKDVPGKDLLFNEWTSAGFHMYFWKHVNNDQAQALKMIEETSGWMWGELRRRYPTYAVNSLATQLEYFAATPDGQKKKAAGTLTSSMFPFALLDMITHFGMTDAEFKLEYSRNQHAELSKALTEYWNHRAAIRKLCEPHFAANPIRFKEAVAAVHTYFQQPATILTKP
jgi:hypothetical protein